MYYIPTYIHTYMYTYTTYRMWQVWGCLQRVDYVKPQLQSPGADDLEYGHGSCVVFKWFINTYMHACMHAYIYIYIYICVYVFIYIWDQIYIQLYIYIHIHIILPESGRFLPKLTNSDWRPFWVAPSLIHLKTARPSETPFLRLRLRASRRSWDLMARAKMKWNWTTSTPWATVNADGEHQYIYGWYKASIYMGDILIMGYCIIVHCFKLRWWLRMIMMTLETVMR